MVVVRVPKHDELSLTTALDAGAAGIVIPHVETAQEVKDMIKQMYYRTSMAALGSRMLGSKADTQS
jgi:2-keto-3-deoxy-L-rhamnonate aldolase RhmA